MFLKKKNNKLLGANDGFACAYAMVLLFVFLSFLSVLQMQIKNQRSELENLAIAELYAIHLAKQFKPQQSEGDIEELKRQDEVAFYNGYKIHLTYIEDNCLITIRSKVKKMIESIVIFEENESIIIGYEYSN